MTRQELMTEIAKLFPPGNFIAGAYPYEPSIPFGNYAKFDSRQIRANNIALFNLNYWVVRIVTESPEYPLYEQFENLMETLDVGWEFRDDADGKLDNLDKVYCVEYIVETVDPVYGK